eukprot:CAMPEP_0168454850 /NCGR_PEP_ID=MMETSP0228-20121227/50435_1 /TAXON_ID=133427 /ORGANISM="Protoceratium reticulatum, Strain CCCM 535 (=CCMP 1889)" /LENGTH=276 /DNA_ID=CAMNT_0008469653 /DNA_START=150 /DNA_END=976 /DNA_ORIENTATION=+
MRKQSATVVIISPRSTDMLADLTAAVLVREPELALGEVVDDDEAICMAAEQVLGTAMAEAQYPAGRLRSHAVGAAHGAVRLHREHLDRARRAALRRGLGERQQASQAVLRDDGHGLRPLVEAGDEPGLLLRGAAVGVLKRPHFNLAAGRLAVHAREPPAGVRNRHVAPLLCELCLAQSCELAALRRQQRTFPPRTRQSSTKGAWAVLELKMVGVKSPAAISDSTLSFRQLAGGPDDDQVLHRGAAPLARDLQEERERADLGVHGHAAEHGLDAQLR